MIHKSGKALGKKLRGGVVFQTLQLACKREQDVYYESSIRFIKVIAGIYLLARLIDIQCISPDV
jgi:hypothetical protein